MSGLAENWFNGVRWLPVRNYSGEVIPPFAAMRPRSIDTSYTGNNTGIQVRGVSFNVDKPNAWSENNQKWGMHLFNGPTAIPIGGRGMATREYPCCCLLDPGGSYLPSSDGTIHVGFKSGSWLLWEAFDAFSLWDLRASAGFLDPNSGGYRGFIVPNAAPQNTSGGACTTEVSDSSVAPTSGTAVLLTLNSPTTFNASFVRDGSNQAITVPSDGLYLVNFSISASGDQPGKTITFSILQQAAGTPTSLSGTNIGGGVRKDPQPSSGTITTLENIACTGIAELTEGEHIAIRCSTNNATAHTVSLSLGQLRIQRL